MFWRALLIQFHLLPLPYICSCSQSFLQRGSVSGGFGSVPEYLECLHLSKTQEQDKPYFSNLKRLYQMAEDAPRTCNLFEDERQPWADISSARDFILLFTALRSARNAFFSVMDRSLYIVDLN